MGSPDPNGRQLNGMGGGISSLSKVMVVRPSERPDVDIEVGHWQVSTASNKLTGVLAQYTFIQVGIKDNILDTAGELQAIPRKWIHFDTKLPSRQLRQPLYGRRPLRTQCRYL